VFDEKLYKQWIAKVKAARPPEETIAAWFTEMLKDWEHFTFLAERSKLLDKPPQFRYWSEWEAWLADIRTAIMIQYDGCRYSEEVFAAVLRAAELMGRHIASGLNQTKVAGWVNLSRSYFSAVFKDIVGKTFNEYVRDLRIARAKRLMLEHKHKPIYWIAEQAGFQDEGYFSRVFREHTGLLPSEYRVSPLL
jgi:two-component system response regulator YesN